MSGFRMAAPTVVSTTSSSIKLLHDDIIVEPKPSDSEHPGNVSFQRIINLNKGQFKSAADKTEKLRIAKAIVQSIYESKARFMERSNDAAEEWREVDVREATKVVILALRGVQPVPVKAEFIDVTDENDAKQQVGEMVKRTQQSSSTTEPAAVAVIHRPKISMDQLIKLGKDQMAFSKYPIGCRVQYDCNTKGTPIASSVKFVTSLRLGRVTTVYMDLDSRGFVYEVLPCRRATDDSTSELLLEEQLCYGPGATITAKFSDANTSYDGEIMQCILESQAVKLYNVMLFTESNEAQIFKGVPGDIISYRHDVEPGTAKQAEIPVEAPTTPKPTQTNQKSPAATISTSTNSNKRSASPDISSITQDTHCDKEKPDLERPAKVQKCTGTVRSSNDTDESKKQIKGQNDALIEDTRVAQSQSNAEPRQNMNDLIVDIPSWLQKEYFIRKGLFNHLMGRNRASESGYKIKTLTDQTGCDIRIRGPEFKTSDERDRCPHMHVVISPQPCQFPSPDPIRAKTIIQEWICDFLREDGSKPRLFYDFAWSEKRNRCPGSTSNAVWQRNPFTRPSNKVCMTIFALPRTISPSGEAVFHGGFLLKGQIKSEIRRGTNCTIILCGDSYNLPSKLSEPHGVIYGDSPANVDKAIAIVKGYISKHQSKCSCIFPKSS